MTWRQFAARYCDTQQSTVEQLRLRLREQVDRYTPDGFFLAEAQLFDSSWFGQVVSLPFGPRNTFKEVPDFPFTPRGLASDTSEAIGWIPAEEVPQARVCS
jgi:hypothetical protein